MRILVVNPGSSSIKFSLFDALEGGEPRTVLEGELSGIGQRGATLRIDGQRAPKSAPNTTGEAVEAIFQVVTGPGMAVLEALGYRVVHPGTGLNEHQRITPEVVRQIEQAAAFAPLHDPEAVAVIRQGLARFPSIPHFACFDTVFHRTMPEEATTYPLPDEVRSQGVRRFGFHGLSCESILRQMPKPLPRRMAIAHLGSGCSVTAVVDGRSVDTTMGLTPTGGVVMGTRPGDLDPGLILYLLRQPGATPWTVEAMLNHSAGLVGLTELANDMKVIREAASQGNRNAVLALKVFTRSLTKALGGFSWLLGGLDAIVFTGGIGEHDATTRTEVLAGLQTQGIVLDATLNLGKSGGVRAIHASDSTTAVFIVSAQEDLTIAMHVASMAGPRNPQSDARPAS